VIVGAAGSATTSLDAQAPGPTIPVALQPACALKVIVADLDDPTSVATVRITGSDGRPYTALSWTAQPRSEWRMTGGLIDLTTLPPGGWTVSVATADGRSWQGSAATSPGPPATLVLE
jgi:hypothetical protein